MRAPAPSRLTAKLRNRRPPLPRQWERSARSRVRAATPSRVTPAARSQPTARRHPPRPGPLRSISNPRRRCVPTSTWRSRSTSEQQAGERPMKKATKSNEFLFEVFSLILIAVLVQGVFATLVRPRAEALRAHDLEMMKTDKNYVPKRSPYVIVKDYEQEVCIIFSLWAFSILAYKAAGVRRARALLATDLLRLPEGMKILPEDTPRLRAAGRGAARDAARRAAAARAAHRAASLRLDTQHPGRLDRDPRRLRTRIRPARFRAVDGALRRVGHPGDRLRRHRARHRRIAAAGAQGGRRRRLGRRGRPRHVVQFHAGRACRSASS